MERALIEYLLNALWQVPLLAGGAWLLLRMVRPAPQIQHRVWLAVLGLSVLLPVHGMPSIAMQPTSTGTQAHRASREDYSASFQKNYQRPIRMQPSAFFPYFTPRTGSIRVAPAAIHWFVGLYVATIVIGLFRIARAWRGAQNLLATSREISLSPEPRAVFEHYGQRLGVRLPQLRESGEVSSPMIVGVARPALLLPQAFDRHTANEVRAALCHELAHVKRRDYLVNVLCRLAALPLVWHPVVHEVQQRIRMTREMVCDAMAAEEMESQVGYANCLLSLARTMLGGMPAHTQFLGLFSNNTLEERVMRLMETTTMSVRARAARIAAGAVVMFATGIMAAMFHITPAMAQADAPPQPKQTAPAAPQPPPSSAPVTHSNQTLTPTDKLRLEQKSKKKINEAQRQMAKATEMLNSPAFKKQMEDAQQQMAKATETLNSPEFKKQMEDAQQQMTKATEMLNSPQFKRRMEDAQQQMAKATEMLNSPQFRKQMEDAQRQTAKATEMLNSPQFKLQMEDAQRQVAKAAAMLNSPQFKLQIDEAQKQLDSSEWKREMEEIDRQLKEAFPQTGETQDK